MHVVEEPATEQDLVFAKQTKQVVRLPKVIINGHKVPMKLHNGAVVTIMSEKDFAENFPDLSYNSEKVKLGVYKGTTISVKVLRKST